MEQEKITCPVCRQWVFKFPGEYEECPICGWFEDPIQQADHDRAGGCNHMSVNQYKKAWEAGKVGPYDENNIDDDED